MADRMAKVIKVTRGPRQKPYKIEIDGEEFPYFTGDGYEITVKRDHSPRVQITLVADRVEVVDNWLEYAGEAEQ